MKCRTEASADLFVDGVVEITNYAGHTDYLANPGLVWGVVYGPGQGNFNLVELETGPFVNINSVNAAGGASGVAQNGWIEIYGDNLAPPGLSAADSSWNGAPEFASGKMPTQLHGVSVMVNGKPA